MDIGRRALPMGALLGAIALAAVSTPASLSGQQEPLDLGTERLTAFARAHIAINDARDEFHGQIGRIHEEQGRLRARQQLQETIAEILAEEEMSQEEYDQFILIISLDAETRAAFEEILAELAVG